jgi:predicted small secreted protein
MNKILLLIAAATLTGCMTVEGMNADLARIDQAWEIDNKAAIAQRQHVVNADYNTAFKVVEKTLTDLGMPIVKSSIEKGFVISKNEAPIPLTKEQWERVREVENPRMSDVAGWMYAIPEDPKGQFVNTKVSIESAGNQSTVSLDYYINVPQYDDMGLITPKNVAPLAEKLACESFWKQLDKNLSRK